MDSYSNAADVLGNLRLMEQNEVGNNDAMFMDGTSYEPNHNNVPGPNNNANYISAYPNINPNMTSFMNANGIKKEESNSSSIEKINSPLNPGGKNNPSNQQQQQPMEPAKSLDKSQLLTVVQFLKKYNFHNTEEILLKETSNLLSEDDLKSKCNQTIKQ